MNLNEFSQQIEAFRTRLTDIQRQVSAKPDQREMLLEPASPDITTFLEGLRVAEEALRVQDEQLAMARVAAEGWRHYYEDLFDFAPDAYVVTDLYGLIREANRAAGRLLGLEPQYLLNQSLATFVLDDDCHLFREMVTGLAQERRVREHEMRIKTPQGEVRFAALTAGVTEQRQGETLSLRWLIRDASARPVTEEDWYRRLVSEILDYAIILTDPRGQILSWNRGAENILAGLETEMLGKSADLIFTPEDRARGVPGQERQKAVEAGRAIDERWHQRLNGERFWGSGVMIALRDSEGTLRWFAKVMRDMTAQRQAQEAMRRDLIREQHIAGTFQRALLPDVAPDAFPGLSVAHLYEAAWQEAQVGGDFYDAYCLEDGRVALVVGDVSGKGLMAAVRAGEIKAALRTVLREHPDPAVALARLNAFVCDRQSLDGEEEHLFATLALVLLDPTEGEMICALAGADSPLLLRSDGSSQAVIASSMMLGVMPKQSFTATTHILGPGDRVLLVTDGVTEARRGSEFLDPDGVLALALAAAAEPPQTMCQAVLNGARAFAGGSLSDDACLLAAERL